MGEGLRPDLSLESLLSSSGTGAGDWASCDSVVSSVKWAIKSMS